jgi:hypothetical protein
MSAFNFDLSGNGKCVSNTNITRSYDDGVFNFDDHETSVGNSLENKIGGMGGFVGPDHEYILYC